MEHEINAEDDNIMSHLYMNAKLLYEADVERSPWQKVESWPILDELEDLDGLIEEANERESLLSGMDKLLLYVTRRLQGRGLKVYTSIAANVSQFSAEFMVVLESSNGDMHTATYITSWLAIAIEDDDVIRDGDIVIKALAMELATRVWVDDAPHVPKDAIVLMERVG